MPILTLGGLTMAQPQTSAAAAAPADPVVQAAQDYIGRTLILRGCYGGTEMVFDAHGHLVSGEAKKVDWTLAGMNVEKVTRGALPNEAGDLVLEGPRVAIRYNPQQRQFERHPLKDEPLRIVFPAPDAAGVVKSMQGMFSVGIDPALQRSMPTYWQHYFLPATAWAGGDAVGTAIAPQPNQAGIVLPVAGSKVEPEITVEAQKDKVHGEVRVRVAVGLDGVPRQITVRQPLGYGLDEKAVAAVAKERFTPGTKEGVPAVVEMVVSQVF